MLENKHCDPKLGTSCVDLQSDYTKKLESPHAETQLLQAIIGHPTDLEVCVLQRTRALVAAVFLLAMAQELNL